MSATSMPPVRRVAAAAAPVAALGQRLRPSRAAVVDLVGVGLLVVLALVGFATVYTGPWWILAAAVGLVLGLGVGQVVVALRLPGVVAAVGLLGGYLLVGPLLTAADGLTPPGVLLTTAVTGWKQLLTTLPPVESRGPLLALPLLFALVGGGTAYGLARRWPGTVRALLVPAALLVVSFLLGTMTPASVLLQGGGFALAAIGYAALRAARARPAVAQGAGASTRAVTAGVLLALAAGGALVVGPRLPGAGDNPRTVWRTALEPPFDLARFPSPLAGFRKFTEPNPAALYDRPLLTVQGLVAGAPIRFATLDAYDGAVWGAGTSTGSAFRRVGTRLAPSSAAPVAAEAVETTLTFAVPEGGWSDVWLPTAGTVTGIDFAGPRAEALRADLRYNTETATALVPTRLMPGDSYRVTAFPAALPTQVPTDVPLATGSLVDAQSLGFLDAKIDAWSGREVDPWRRITGAAAAFRGAGAYTDGGVPGDYQNVFLPGHSLARVTRFVRAPQLAGNDEQYAATLALVAVRLGVPARVVLGAIPDATGVVKGRDVHAWVEVLRADGGWQAIPPQLFVPDRNKRPTDQQQRAEEKKEGAVVPPPAANNPPSILQGPDQAQNAAPNRSQGTKRSLLDLDAWPAWLRWFLRYAGPPLLLVGLAAALVLGLKARRRRARRTGGTPARQVEGGWAELLDVAADLRLPVPVPATRLEQAGALAAALPTAALPIVVGSSAPALADPGISRLAREGDALVFGPLDPTPAASAGYWERVDAAVAGLRAALPRRRRLLAAVSTRSLRPAAPAGPRRRTVRVSVVGRRLARLARQQARRARQEAGRARHLAARGRHTGGDAGVTR